jgi:hypothetical protein
VQVQSVKSDSVTYSPKTVLYSYVLYIHTANSCVRICSLIFRLSTILHATHKYHTINVQATFLFILKSYSLMFSRFLRARCQLVLVPCENYT